MSVREINILSKVLLISWISTSIPSICCASANLDTSAAHSAACPRPKENPSGPFVPTARAARAIYIAARDAVAPGYRSIKHSEIIVQDESDHWTVVQNIRVRNSAGRYVDISGGGGLWLQIDKCTGEILHAGFSR
jgi:hypothetical protein